jgi:hypothetical protein
MAPLIRARAKMLSTGLCSLLVQTRNLLFVPVVTCNSVSRTTLRPARHHFVREIDSDRLQMRDTLCRHLYVLITCDYLMPFFMPLILIHVPLRRRCRRSVLGTYQSLEMHLILPSAEVSERSFWRTSAARSAWVTASLSKATRSCKLSFLALCHWTES